MKIIPKGIKLIKPDNYLIIFLILYLVLVPIGLNGSKYLVPSINPSNIENQSSFASFTSLNKDVILLINGDKNLISQNFYDWLSNFVFTLENNPTIQNYKEKLSEIRFIFNEGDQLLASYLTNLDIIVSAANITTYIFLNGTYLISQEILNQINANVSDPLGIAMNNSQNILEGQVNNLSLGQQFLSFVNIWIDQVFKFVNSTTISSNLYNTIVDNWKVNTTYWVSPFLSTGYADAISFFLNKIDNKTSWDENFIYTNLSQLLFNNSTNTYTDFLNNIFDHGNSTAAVQIKRDILIPFLRNEYLPPGFSNQVRDFYLRTYTNSNGKSIPTALIVQIRLKDGLTSFQIEQLLNTLNDYVKNSNIESKFGYSISIASEFLYTIERGKSVSNELHFIDIITFILGFILLYYLFRNPILVLVVTLTAWLTTEVSKGILVLVLPHFISLVDISFSLSSTILLGAAMNYSVFFIYRVNEELKKNKLSDAIKIGRKTALHSIFISGTAIFLSYIPLITSALLILQVNALCTTIGILIEMFLLINLLPRIFNYLGQYNLNLQFIKKSSNIKSKFPKLLNLKHFRVTHNNSKKVLLLAFILTIISISIVVFSKSTFVANDIINTQGQTGEAFKIIETNFPNNYFSKILLVVNFTSPIKINSGFNQSIFSDISKISEKLSKQNGIETMISPAWPLGTYFNFSNPNVALISRETATLVSNQLIDTSINQVYFIIQLIYDSTEQIAITETGNLLQNIGKYIKTLPTISDFEFNGILVDAYTLSQQIISQLPYQILISIILLTSFLWYELSSITVPLRLELTIILGSIYALGIGTIIWQLFFNSPLNIIINTTSVITLLGLGTDFDIYLFNRIKEELNKGHSIQDAIDTALSKSSPAIKASGLIMSFAFLTLIFGNLRLTQQFGLITAISVLIDIFLIRMYLVPAFLLLRQRKTEVK